LYKQLININLSIQDTRNVLVRHVEETQNNFAQIQDEIVSLKKHSSLMCSPTNPKIDELLDKTALIQEEINKLSNSLYTRLNYICDTMKLFQTKTNNTVQPTVEPRSSPSKVSCNKTSTEHQTYELVKERPNLS